MYYINGIQQVGIGVANVYKAWQWYIDHFHFDLPVFDEAAEANLMLPYTEGKPRNRHAVLALNYQGGGGLEIWNHTSFTPRPPKNAIVPGDIGISILKIKVKNLKTSFDYLTQKGAQILSPIDDITKSFLVTDPYHNLIEIIEGDAWFNDKGWHSGGVAGCTLGVKDIEQSIDFYQNILGFDIKVSDTTGTFDLYQKFPNAGKLRSVVLKRSEAGNGAFSPLLGPPTIELLQALDRKPNTIFEGRMWGELGYIHLCFDVNHMDALKKACNDLGYPFTVDSSNSFDMGEAAGRFAYTEDPSGNLIEFVETHKIPILKKMAWYYDLTKRPVQKPLPKLLLAAMALTRVKKAPIR